MKLVLIQLCDTWQGGACFPSVDRIAARIAASRSTVERALRKLEAAGRITRQRTGRTNRYVIKFTGGDPSLDDVSDPSSCAARSGTVDVSDPSPSEASDPSPSDALTNITNLTNPPHYVRRAQQRGVSRETIDDVRVDADGGDQATVGLGAAPAERRGPALVGEVEPPARGSPGPARNGSARRAGDRERPSTQLTLLHAVQSGLIDLPQPTPAEEKTHGNRGSRIRADWWPSPAGVQFAQDLGLDCARIVPEFIDYWQGVAGRYGVKQTWDGTFRNRCRALADRSMGRSPVGAVPAARGNGAFYDELAVIAREARERDGDHE